MFERDVVERLESNSIDYFITGSVALGAWAIFRQTNDVDIVVRLTPREYESRLRPAFEPDYIVNPLTEAPRKWLGAVISIEQAQKADLVLRKPDAWGDRAFERRVRLEDPVLGPVWESSPEDLLIAKLEFSDGTSRKQLEDCEALIRLRPNLDWEYLERHAGALGLIDLLDSLR